MSLSKRRLLTRAVFIFLLLILIPYPVLMIGTATQEFRNFAEEKVSSFLKSKVKIGRIQVAFFNQISLSDFQLQPGFEGPLPGVEVKQIIFRYSLRQLLTWNFKIPSAIILKSPKMIMGQSQFPLALFQDVNLVSTGGKVSEFKLAGGEIRYQIPVIRSSIVLKDIQATFAPIRDGKLQGTFRAHFQGLLEGEISMRGEMNPFTQERHLKGEIQRGSVNQGLLSTANGFTSHFRIDNDTFTLDFLNLTLGDQKIKLKAQLKDFLKEKPILEVNLQKMGPHQKENGEIHADFSKHTLTGKWGEIHAPVPFQGDIFLEENRLTLKKIKSKIGYEGGAFLDFSKGEAGIEIQKGQRRMDLSAHVRDSDLDLDLKLDHVDVSGIDLVTAARVHLEADPFNPERVMRLEGNFETDYFILDTLTLQDFKGDFQLSSQGFSNFSSSWGKFFKATGNIKWADSIPEADLTVRMSRIDLKGIKKFAHKPLPKDLGGILAGKIKIVGPLARPRYVGRLTVKDGWLGKVDFEKAIIQFDGLAPSFKLVDSRVYRGRGTLLITGNVDLQAQNIVHDVKFETLDHIVLYRGLDVSLSTEEGAADLEVHPGINKIPAFGITASGGTTDQEEGGEERSLEIGPRFRF